MLSEFFTSSRHFVLADCFISHSQLLLRALKNQQNPQNIDIIFFGTEFVQLPTRITGLSLLKPIPSDKELIGGSKESVSHNEAIKKYEIKSGDNIYYVKAAFVRIFQNDLELNETSLGVLQYSGREKEIASSFDE